MITGLDWGLEITGVRTRSGPGLSCWYYVVVLGRPRHDYLLCTLQCFLE